MITGADVPVKVSVVVPVWNPGPYIDPCIASLLGQTLLVDEFEVILVDDGSTDGTAARLDALAAEHPTIRVIHIPNSGWPGRPRNIGIESARGEYVQFVDQDDQLTPEALERLYAMGARNGSDIVIGKVAGSFRSHAAVGDHAIRGVPQVLFRQNRERCTIADAPLIDSLTPHKMFRTSFLRSHGLLFPEGRMRLEDQLFVVPAYFAASVVSVLGDHVCYLYQERADGGNAGSVTIDPSAYYADLRSVLEIVVANTEPGDLRTRLLRRFYRVEMLGRLSEPSFHQLAPEFRDGLYRAIRSIAMDLIDPSVDATLGPVLRLRSMFLREDRPDALVELARRLAPTRATWSLEGLAWSKGRLGITFGASLDTSFGRDIAISAKDGGWLLDPALTDGLLAKPLELSDEEVRGLRAIVLVRDRVSGAQWILPTKTALEGLGEGDGRPARPILDGTATLEPLAAAGKNPLGQGTWEVWARVTGLGLDQTVRASLGSGAGSSTPLAIEPAILGDRPTSVVPFVDEGGGLSIDVGTGERSLASAIAVKRVRFVRDGRRLVARLPIATDATTVARKVTLTLRHGDEQATLPGRLEARAGGMLLRADLGGSLSGLRRGPWTLSVDIDPPGGPAVVLGDVRLGRFRRLLVEGPARVRPLANARWIVGEWVRQVDARLPGPIRRGLRAGWRAIR